MEPTDEPAPPDAPPPHAPRHGLAWHALALALTAVVYLRTLGYPFCWDDQGLVRDNRRLGSASLVLDAFRSDFWAPSTVPEPSGMYRPLVWVSYTLDRAFGPGPAVFHATNLALHLANLALLMALARRLGAAAQAASLGALLFALHPCVVENVANVSSRTDPMVALFGLLALHARLHASSLRAESLGALSLLAALLSKEQGLVLLPLLVLFDRHFDAPLVERPRDQARRLLGPALAFGLYLALRVNALGVAARSGGEHAWHPWEGPVQTLRYLALALAPLRLSAVHDPPPAGPLLGVAAAACLLALGLALWRRGPRLLRFAALWFALSLAAVSGWLPLTVRFSEAFLYIPLLGPALAAGLALGRHPRARYLAAAALVPLALLSAARVPVWRSEIALWSDAAQRSPASPIAQLNLGNALRAEGRDLEAERALRSALTLARERRFVSNEVLAGYLLGSLYRDHGRLDEAGLAFRDAARRSGGSHHRAAFGLAQVRLQQGQLREARNAARVAWRAHPTSPRYAVILGQIAQREGDPAEARRWYLQALALSPGHPAARSGMASLGER